MGWVRTLTRPEIWESTWEDSAAPRLVFLPLNLILHYGGAGCRVRRSMARTLGPILKTLLFTILVPGFVTLYVPYLLLGRGCAPGRGPLAWLGIVCAIMGAAIYFRCAWEFAVRGLGTPAPIAPTKYLVVTGLHRYVRNPMYIGVSLVMLGQAALFRAPRVAEYGALCILLAHLFILFYEEPTLRSQFGESYEKYRATVPRWIPRFRR